MSARLIPTFFASALIVLSVEAAFAQSGGLQGQMDKMFGQMSTSSSPAVQMDARRGVISGGALEIRAPVAPPAASIVNFSPPSVTAGCSGISLYGGSLSFLSADQLIQEFRSIASNAEGLAFQMALRAMSDQLSSEVQTFEDIQRKLSVFQKNSCELAQEALDKSGASAEIQSFGTAIGKKVSTEDGTYSDPNKAMEADQPKSSLSNKVNSPEVYGNIVWKALQKAKTSFTFGGGDQFDEEVMSLVGTIIVCNPDTDSSSCPKSGGDDGIGITPVAPRIKLADLVYGSTPSSQQLYSCNDSQCMKMGTRDWSNPGFIYMVQKQLGVADDGSTGLLQTILAGSKPTDQMLAFMANMGASGTLLAQIGHTNPNAAEGYAKAIAKPLALEMARQLADSMLQTVKTALAGNVNPAAGQMMDELNARQREIDRDYNAMRQDHKFDLDAFALYKVYADTAPSMTHMSPRAAQ